MTMVDSGLKGLNYSDGAILCQYWMKMTMVDSGLKGLNYSDGAILCQYWMKMTMVDSGLKGLNYRKSSLKSSSTWNRLLLTEVFRAFMAQKTLVHQV